MTGAMYAAIAGLKTHMSKLNVIGNNIANVNTYGYKSARTVFHDALYTTSQAGSNGTSVMGGRNPSQIGYGVQIASIDLDMSTGNYSPTGRSSDCMIDGDGFFMVGDKTTADAIARDPADPDQYKRLTLSRVGNFEIKADGYLCDGNGNVVYGFLCTGAEVGEDGALTGKMTFSDQLVPLRLPMMNELGKAQYPEFYTEQNLATGKVVGQIKDAEQTDADGKPFTRCEVDSITIDPTTGRVTAVTKEDEPIVMGYIAVANVTNPNGLTHESGPYFKVGDGAGNMSVALLGGADKDITIGKGNDTETYADGFYINHSLREDDADDPEGAKCRSGGTTALITGGLEQSKTDLATEIAEMITTQRGYQANTRIITVTDSMLEELVNIKR